MQPDVQIGEVRRRAGHDLLLFPAAIYGNRRPHELAAITMQFEPAHKPRPLALAIGELPDAIRRHLRATNTDAFVAVRDGQIVYEYYAPGMHEASQHMLYSAAKSWTSLVWSPHCTDERLAQPLAAHVPQLEDTALGAATLRQCLDMRVEIDYDLTFDAQGKPTGLLAAAHAVSGFGHPLRDQPLGWSHFLRQLPGRPERHGKVWRYVDANPYAFSLAMQQATGLREIDVWRDAIDQIGFEHRSTVVINAAGELSSAGGFATTARDWAKVGQLVLDRGQIERKAVIPERYVKDLFEHPGTPMAKGPSATAGYRSYWRRTHDHISLLLFEADIHQIWAIGSYGKYLVVDPTTQTVVVKFSTYPKLVESPEEIKSGYFARDASFLMILAQTVPKPR
jgi:CubicO group peptidase (beta-lactamase class C family)